jgi:hypothetical protein
MAIDHSLDFFGVDLQPTDINDAASASDEVAAAVAPFDHVAGVHEPVLIAQRALFTQIAQRGPRRSDAERSVVELYPHTGIVLIQQRGGKS